MADACGRRPFDHDPGAAADRLPIRKPPLGPILSRQCQPAWTFFPASDIFVAVAAVDASRDPFALLAARAGAMTDVHARLDDLLGTRIENGFRWWRGTVSIDPPRSSEANAVYMQHIAAWPSWPRRQLYDVDVLSHEDTCRISASYRNLQHLRL